MARSPGTSDKDPVHHALRNIVQQLLKGMDVKTSTPRSVDHDGVEVKESHLLPVFYITAFSSQFPDLPAVTRYIAPFLGVDEKIPESQRRVLAGHVAPQGVAMLGNNYSAIRLIVDGEPESVIFKNHTQG